MLDCRDAYFVKQLLVSSWMFYLYELVPFSRWLPLLCKSAELRGEHTLYMNFQSLKGGKEGILSSC